MTHWLDTDEGMPVSLCGYRVNPDSIVNEYTSASCPLCQAMDRRPPVECETCLIDVPLDLLKKGDAYSQLVAHILPFPMYHEVDGSQAEGGACYGPFRLT